MESQSSDGTVKSPVRCLICQTMFWKKPYGVTFR